MNRNDFINMMDNSVHPDRQLLAEIFELIDIFPYFQSAHLLLLKELHGNNDVKFARQLGNSAIHIADREILYYQLLNIADPEHSASGQGPSGDNINEKELSPGQITDTDQTVIEAANSQEMINDLEEKDSSSIYGRTVMDDNNRHNVLVDSEADMGEYAGILLITEEEPDSPEDKIFFMDPGIHIPERTDLLEIDVDADNSDNIEFVTPTVIVEQDPKKLLQAELIDKFIVSNPKIEPNREKKDIPEEDKSKPVYDEGGFITETLAKIYMNQHYYSKAIAVYEKLSLKYPEKSSYFATQIEKIKEYLKN